MDPIELTVAVVGSIFVLCGLAQLYFYLTVFSRFATYKVPAAAPQATPSVSVIICAKNEAKNLLKNLPSILEQDYPDFEVIVVNNCSWDESKDILEDFESKYPQLKVVSLFEQEKYPKGKKFGLTLGIKAAKNNILLLTDADCKPQSKNWIRQMAGTYRPGTEIVLGYSPYAKAKGFLNRFIRFECMYTALQYFSWSLKHKTYMGVGRNLSYSRALFFQHKGFASHNHIISGDDDLFVNEAATATNTEICIQPDSFMLTYAKSTWQSYFHQKTRHLNTGKYYKRKQKWALAILNISHILFYLTMITLLIIGMHWEAVLIIFLIRFITQAFILWPTCRKLRDKKIFYLFPIFDICYVGYYILTGLKALFVKQRAWMY